MQYVQNGLIKHLTNGSRIIFVETNFTLKKYDKFRKSRTAVEIALLDKSNLFICHQHVHE